MCVIVRGSTCTTSRVVSGQGLPLPCCCTISGLMISCTVKTSVISIRELWKILVPSPLIPGLFSSFMCRYVLLWFAGAFIWCMSSGSTFGTVRQFGDNFFLGDPAGCSKNKGIHPSVSVVVYCASLDYHLLTWVYIVFLHLE